MKVVRLSSVPTEEATSALFTGNVVTRQAPFTADDSNNFNFGVVSFSAGSRNKFHKHSGDQILIVTEGAQAPSPPMTKKWKSPWATL